MRKSAVLGTVRRAPDAAARPARAPSEKERVAALDRLIA